MGSGKKENGTKSRGKVKRKKGEMANKKNVDGRKGGRGCGGDSISVSGAWQPCV